MNPDLAHQALDHFGEMLVRDVRNEIVSHWRRILNGQMKDPRLGSLAELLASNDPACFGLIHELLPRIADTALFYLLRTLESESTIEVAVQIKDERVPSIRETSDGLAGELYGSRGWLERFGV